MEIIAGGKMQEFINSYWQPALYTLLVFIVARLSNKLWVAVATMVIKQNLYEKALLAILYDRLFQLCQNYIAAKRISTEELKNLETSIRKLPIVWVATVPGQNCTIVVVSCR